ncbi:protein containing RNA polymerase sigma factor 70, region 4 type 2 domain [methanotrophic bacterial endosymbiont of Bathymodiolus sp.]|nr:protein containing RNA polymerase sigma factor 70, region 4 type 2 domain [methanotrophic bacterial endosymbiont of Bathymodiolus sp.]
MGHIAVTVTPVEDEINNSMVFSKLPPAFRDVLILTKVAGFTTRETADKLGISESTVRVRVRVHHVIKETRKILEIDEYPESN